MNPFNAEKKEYTTDKTRESMAIGCKRERHTERDGERETVRETVRDSERETD